MIIQQKQVWLSTLRGICVFLVFFSHLSYIDISRPLLFITGRVGVVGFFVISGYLVYTSLEKRTWRQFLLNRIIKIYPIYWLLLLLTFWLGYPYELLELFWNMTLFEELFGYEKMIGPSWMLPIMIICYFVFLSKKIISYKMNVMFVFTCMFSVLLAYARYTTNLSLPTALGLLSSVSMLGWIFKEQDCRLTSHVMSCFVLFNISLCVASWLSYGDRYLLYILSYNLALLSFYLFNRYRFTISFFDKMGSIGFTFFLGARIPIDFVDHYLYPLDNLNPYLIGILQFILTFGFSWIVTQYIEYPLLNYGKKLENKL